jgi:hypothetical protein
LVTIIMTRSRYRRSLSQEDAVALGSVGPGSLLGAFGSEQTPPRLSDGSNADLWDGAAQADGAYTVRSLRGRGREGEREREREREPMI